MVSQLGSMLASQPLKTIAKKITKGKATFESHVLSVTSTEALQLANLFEPSGNPLSHRVTSEVTV